MGLTHFVDQLHNNQLENVTKSMDLIDTRAEVIQSSVLYEQNYTKLSLGGGQAMACGTQQQ